MTALAEYVRHAERFGGELVFETARSEWVNRLAGEMNELRRSLPPPADITWMAPEERERLLDRREIAFADYHDEVSKRTRRVRDDLMRLRIVCDESEAKRNGKRKAVRRRLAEDTVIMVKQLRSERFPIPVIADKLGITDAHVKRCLREVGQVQDLRNNGRNPSVHAADSAPKSKVRPSVV
jgi:hypothetical protein